MISPFDASHFAVWAIAAASVAGVIFRPFRWPEAIWACGGGFLLVVLRLLPASQAVQALGKGLDVYLFLIGMMLLAETARREGLFDDIATLAVSSAKHSPQRLFLMIYVVGVAVTVFLSNDATAVVLTPAVYAAAKKAKVDAKPYLFICAFTANAASFALPISNPANIVLYGGQVPALGPWLLRFALPSVGATGATFWTLRWLEGRRFANRFDGVATSPRLSKGALTCLAGLGLTAMTLLGVSALNLPLGAPTLALGVLTSVAALVRRREGPQEILKGVSWAVLPLVAGLFVLVQSLEFTGAITSLAALVAQMMSAHPAATPWALGVLIAVGSNLLNNLPAGLIAASTMAEIHAAPKALDALLIGVDLGPNFSITGSLATILWLAAIRREGEDIGFWGFLKVGSLVTPPALVAALAARLLWPV